jgi:hypothetical protein
VRGVERLAEAAVVQLGQDDALADARAQEADEVGGGQGVVPAHDHGHGGGDHEDEDGSERPPQGSAHRAPSSGETSEWHRRGQRAGFPRGLVPVPIVSPNPSIIEIRHLRRLIRRPIRSHPALAQALSRNRVSSLSVIRRMRKVGAADEERHTRSLPIASTSSSIC